MHTRKEIHAKINNYLANNLPDKLQKPLIKEIKIFSKNDFEQRLNIRTAVDEQHLGNWWRHPIYLLATPKDKQVLVQFELSPQRWPKDVNAYAKENQATLEEYADKVKELTKEYFEVDKEAQASTKLKDKYMASIKTTVKFADDVLDQDNLKKITEYLVRLAAINLELSRKLTIGAAEESVGDEEPEEEQDQTTNLTPEQIDYLENNFSYWDFSNGKIDNKWVANKDFMLAAVQQDGSALEYASEELKADREVVLALVQKYGRALKYASEELKADREVVMAAVQQHGGALEYASEELKADKEVVLVAVASDLFVIELASKAFRADREVVLKAVKKNGQALRYVTEELRSDREVLLEAVKTAGWVLEYASKELRADREIVLAAVKNHGRAIEYASEELYNDREVMMEAVKNDGVALEFASKHIRDDKEFLIEAIKYNSKVLNCVPKKLKGVIKKELNL